MIGGADICAVHDLADRLEVTEVHAAPSGDTRFAGVDATWQEVARTHHSAGEGDSADFSYVTYRRRAAR
jgi:dihydrofolate reductase